MDNALFSQLAMELQSLHALDLLTISVLALLEGILSVDNALVLAILVRQLPEDQRKKALLYGIVGAFVFRLIALVFAGYLIRFMFFKLIGGAYLVYLAMKHMFFFYKEDAHQTSPKTSASFWRTVAAVELTDIAFSIDSITTAVAMSNKLIIIWLGGVLGIIFLRFCASYFVKLLEKLPMLEDLAYQLIFFIGTKLTLESFGVEIDHSIFWVMMVVIATIGAALVYRDQYQKKTRDKFHNRLLDRLGRGEVQPQELLDMEYIPREVITHLLEKGCLRLETPSESGSCTTSRMSSDRPQ